MEYCGWFWGWYELFGGGDCGNAASVFGGNRHFDGCAGGQWEASFLYEWVSLSGELDLQVDRWAGRKTVDGSKCRECGEGTAHQW